MAEPYQPLSVSTGSAQQAIQSTPNVTPALQDLMQGITSGMISLGDLQKRNANIPLETAQRNAELTDLQQLRPLQREAQVAQLQNLRAKQQFEAESLPILNDIKRETLKQEYSDVLQHGVPSAVLKTFNATVPGLIPFDQAKLFDQKMGGQLNTSYALELIGKAIEKAEKLKLNAKFTGPVQQKVTDASGKMTETTTVMNQLSGETVGAPITTETKEPQPGVNIKDAKSTRYNPVKNVEEEIIQRYNPNTGELVGEAIVLSENPVKLTQEQANALQFSSRMDLNNQIISDLETAGFEPTAFKTTVQKWLPNRLQPEQLQAYTAAQRNWITATLRKESGAAINQNEYARANKEYFPIDGDTPAVVKQKAALRELAEENIRMSSRIGGAAPAAAQPASGAATTTPTAAALAGENPVVTAEQARTLPPTVKYFRLVAGGPLKWNPNHPESPTQMRLRAAPVAPTVQP